jgi:hypothetical protein
MVAKKGSSYKENKDKVDKLLEKEEGRGLGTLKPYEEFKQRVYGHKEELVNLIKDVHRNNKKIIGYGASTKGNVILQFCGLTEKDIPFIAEVNTEKFGSFTPGTKIPIISEEKAREMNPDYFLVLPWHFRDFILKKEEKYLSQAGKIIFPLPSPQIVER